MRALCDLLEVSPSGYYRWRKRQLSAHEREDAALASQIAAARRRSRGNYGSPRIVIELRENGTPISRRRCSRLMRIQALCGRKRHRRRPRTTDSTHKKPVAENQLGKHHGPIGPDQVWITDINYLR